MILDIRLQNPVNDFVHKPKVATLNLSVASLTILIDGCLLL